ncbi:MOP flippase family protein [Clostridium perfringens]|uniref:MOP flippase family protein n=1 Tax=Clostridium perfringens TaxID=1502 RepID=UPI0024BD3C85|nr:MOP flippase family protein [Clostridium perfringens]
MEYVKHIKNGTKWNTVRMLAITIIQFITTIIIGIFLTTEQYGLYGMVNVFTGLAFILADCGLSNVIIYKQENDSEKISTLFWLNLIIGIMTTIIAIIIIPLAVWFYKEPKLTGLIKLMSINFLIIPIGQIHFAILKQNFEFKKIAIIDLLANIIYLFSIVFFAYNNYGAYSIIIAQILKTLVSSILYLLQGNKYVKIKLKFKINEVKEFIHFGLYELGSKITNYFRGNIDYLLVGRFLGSANLGIYTFAYQLILMPIMKINPILTDTMYPVFTKFKSDNKELKTNYLKMLKIISYLIAPIMIGIFFLSDLFITTFYPKEWYQAITVLKIYSIMGIILSLNNPISCILYPKGKFKLAYCWNLISLVITFIFNIIGLQFGLIGITISSTLFCIFIAWPVDFYIRYKIINMGIKEYFDNFKVVTKISIIFIIFIIVILNIFDYLIGKISLFIIPIIGTVIYLILIKIFSKDDLKYLYNNINIFNRR